MLSYDALATPWWPFVFIAIAGWFATDLWRWIGVLAGSRLRDDSIALTLVRSVATALVAAVVAKLILYPTGVLAGSSVILRIAAAAIGFAAFLLTGKKMFVGIAVAIVCLLAGLLVWPLPPA